MEHLLEDITVIDAATFLAGPGASTILADFGANVIKLEPPGGDGYRALVGNYPVPYHWLLTSRNKRSLAVNLRTIHHPKLKLESVAPESAMPGRGGLAAKGWKEGPLKKEKGK